MYDILFEFHHSLYKDSWRKMHEETLAGLAHADKIIAISKSTKNDIGQTYKIDTAKIVVAYPGKRMFPKENKISQKMPFFLFVGALKPSKNVPTLLRAFNLFLKNTKSDTGLLLAGGNKWIDKNIKNALDSLPKETKDHMTFLGNIDDAHLAWLYKNAIGFVSPSISEGFGLTFLEALSFGTPVIGPNTGAVPEVVGKAGILVDPSHVKEIAQAMEVLFDKQKREKLVKHTKAQSSKFEWSNFASCVYEAIERLG